MNTTWPPEVTEEMITADIVARLTSYGTVGARYAAKAAQLPVMRAASLAGLTAAFALLPRPEAPTLRGFVDLITCGHADQYVDLEAQFGHRYRESCALFGASNEAARLRQCIAQFADPTNWADRIGCLQWLGKRHAIEYAQSVLDQAKTDAPTICPSPAPVAVEPQPAFPWRPIDDAARDGGWVIALPKDPRCQPLSVRWQFVLGCSSVTWWIDEADNDHPADAFTHYFRPTQSSALPAPDPDLARANAAVVMALGSGTRQGQRSYEEILDDRRRLAEQIEASEAAAERMRTAWPNGCDFPDVCERAGRCAAFGCDHFHRDIAPEIDAAVARLGK